ncbi:MAG TPA: response regulator [Xanthobacteraceae bacterium]|nr:response regulator [Xanthobacteraceae bacterium]
MREESDPFDLAGGGSAAADAGKTAPRLLVIDDDSLHRMVICRAAAKAGYLPAGAAGYDEAVRLTRETVFDCITLDLGLGDHAGNEMLHHLAKIGCTAPIIVVSGCDAVTCKEAARIAGSLKLDVWECISKPVDLAMLRSVLDRLRDRRLAA